MPKMEYEAIEDFQSAGASKELAQAIVRYVHETQTALLVTKTDLVETREVLRTEMAGMRGEMAQMRTEVATKSELSALEQRLTEKMANQEVRLTDKMSALQSKLTLWMVGTSLGIVALVAGIFQLMK
jgi:hypothetical protein